MTDFTEAAGAKPDSAAMETFTIQDVLINSTDLNQILCHFGLKNLSDCGGGDGSAGEPKGTVNFCPVPPENSATQALGWVGGVFFFLLCTKKSIFHHRAVNFPRAKSRPAPGVCICVSAHYAYGSGPRETGCPRRICLRLPSLPLFCPNPRVRRMPRENKHGSSGSEPTTTAVGPCGSDVGVRKSHARVRLQTSTRRSGSSSTASSSSSACWATA